MPKYFVRSALALSIVALTGCTTVGSDFQAPAAPAAGAYRHADAANFDSARLPAEWWTVFNDPALNALEQRAVRDNPGVKASAQRLLQAQAQLGVFRAAQAPTVNLGASVANSRSSAETSQALALGGRSIKGNNFALGASLSYELDLWGRVQRVVEAADAQALAAQDDRDGVILLLSAQVAGTYWQLRGTDAELAILSGALATRR
ncbi:MAG: transporter, partial [Massilia sp.]|nr:transporter [Massilia sp.]